MEPDSSGKQTKQLDKFSTNNGSLEAFTVGGFKMLVEATKRANNLPFSKMRDFYESYPVFHNLVEIQAGYILSMLSLMVQHTNCKGSLQRKDEDDKFEMIVDANDSILENVGILLDELSGIKKYCEPSFTPKKIDFINGSWNRNDKEIRQGANEVLNKILNQTKNIEKPQLQFKDKVNNDVKVPFEPKIKYKYNMLKPLAIVADVNEDGVCEFSHPYEFELQKFKPSKSQIMYMPPKLYKSLEETPFVIVTKPEEVTAMVENLKNYKEISVDLEHHSYRSFQGFTCLMQISTREEDYIIDTLLLRSELEILNKIFTDPSTVKVFHGADSDILWLQKDLGLYIVNMFDTHLAAKLLQFPKLSLGYLLSYYCNVNAQKHFQLADWRVRPLPQELLHYAREDTHYLLFIYDNLRNSLIEKAHGQTTLLESVISESTRICSKRYIKPQYDKDGYLDIYHRSKKLFDNRQKFALQKLFEWRDKMGRELDESYAYVLPNHMMLNISEVLPREAQGILACCNPIPVPVRQNLLVLHQIILKAREQPLIKPVLDEQRFCRHPTVNSLESPLQCPHDLNHEGEFRDDMPILFDKSQELSSGINDFASICCPSEPIINIFEDLVETAEAMKLPSVIEKAILLSPYHRYKLAKTFSESLDGKQLNTFDGGKFETSLSTLPSMGKTKFTETELKNIQSYDKGTDASNKSSCPNKHAIEESNAFEINNKRKMQDDGVCNSNKVDTDLGLVNSSINESRLYLEPNKGTEIKSQKKQKIKKSSTVKKEKEFQPFNFESVNFEKYQNSEALIKKKVKRKNKIKKGKFKKNFKVSV